MHLRKHTVTRRWAKTEARADLEMGLGGVQKALEVLREYYGSAAAMLQRLLL